MLNTSPFFLMTIDSLKFGLDGLPESTPLHLYVPEISGAPAMEAVQANKPIIPRSAANVILWIVFISTPHFFELRIHSTHLLLNIIRHLINCSENSAGIRGKKSHKLIILLNFFICISSLTRLSIPGRPKYPQQSIFNSDTNIYVSGSVLLCKLFLSKVVIAV